MFDEMPVLKFKISANHFPFQRINCYRVKTHAAPLMLGIEMHHFENIRAKHG